MEAKGERRRVKKVPMVVVVRERFNWWKLHLSEEKDDEDWGRRRSNLLAEERITRKKISTGKTEERVHGLG